MSGLMRRGADLVQRLTGVAIVRPADLPTLYEQQVLRRFFDEFGVDVVFDVGANVGQYAEMLRRKVGYRGAIVSFEPIPELAAVLREKAATDGSWYVEEVALHREPGEAAFNVMRDDQYSSLLGPSPTQPGTTAQGNSVSRQVTVRLDTLVGYFDKYHRTLGFRRPYLKMDTQGNDLAVVEGAAPRLPHFVGLQSEVGIRPLYEGATRFDESIRIYEGLGFSMTAMFPNNLGHFPDMLEMDCVLRRRDVAPITTS